MSAAGGIPTKGPSMLKRLSALALAASLSFPAYAQDASTVVATVNGTDITLGHMIVARATLPQQYQQLPDEILFTGILDQLIQQTALSQAYEGDLPGRVVFSLENETRSLTAAETVEQILSKPVSEEAVQAAYDAEFASQEAGTEYNASHILVETEDAAKDIVEALKGGADFAAMARDKSTGPSGPGGGSLGWFGTGAMVPEFENAVVALEVGAVSEPVKTQFGWHVIKLNETRLIDVPELEDVREQMEQKAREDAVTAQIEALVAQADLEKAEPGSIDPAILRDMSLIE
jgi:peptidyl-prolyl cis-trans isomerase C